MSGINLVHSDDESYDSDDQQAASAPWPFEQPTNPDGRSFVPRARPPREDPLQPYMPGEIKSLAGIAMRAFCIGGVLALSAISMLYLLIFTSHPIWRAPFFVASLSSFHFLEFWTTAQVNTRIVTKESFLLTANWPHYAIAHTVAFWECALVTYFFPEKNWLPFNLGTLLLVLGLVFVLGGQAIRSAAMLQAGASFNHEIQWKKADTHVLVTTGVYSLVRHPSYFGFFYWGIGTQLVMGNAISFFVYTGVLWWFFNRRISFEEAMLTHFFKDDYKDYRKRVGTGIPFIR